MITSFTATLVADGDPAVWLLAFASDLAEPTFRLYQDGVLILTVVGVDLGAGMAGEATAEVPVGSSPVFDVLDDDTTAAPTAYPDRVTLTWYTPDGVDTAATIDHYRIEQEIATVWTEQAQVRDNGSGYLTWTSGRLADGQTHKHRVIPVGANGNDGTAVMFAMLIVRYPDAPGVDYVYDSGTGTVTITAA